MRKNGGKHVAVHINELVLPRGTRMPDQAALRRMVELELQRRFGSIEVNEKGNQSVIATVRGSNDFSGDVSNHVQRRLSREE